MIFSKLINCLNIAILVHLIFKVIYSAIRFKSYYLFTYLMVIHIHVRVRVCCVNTRNIYYFSTYKSGLREKKLKLNHPVYV